VIKRFSAPSTCAGDHTFVEDDKLAMTAMVVREDDMNFGSFFGNAVRGIRD
jgi:hypothetical protein